MTPGPWTNDDGCIMGFEGKECVVICDVSPGGFALTEYDVRNAVVIAALPELVAALRQYTERHEAECDPKGLPEYDKARAAFAKAGLR